MGTPVLPDYVAPFKPVPNVTPFTYRDGNTVLKKVTGIIKYLNLVIVPFVNENFTDLGDAFEEQVNVLIEQVNAAVDAILNSSVEIQDPLVAQMIEDEDSDTRGALDARYALKSVVDTIDTIITSGRLSDAELDTAYAAKSAFDELAEVVNTGRLSEAELDERYTLATDFAELEAQVNASVSGLAKYPAANVSAETLRNSNISLGRALAGGTPYKIMIAGDSTSQGSIDVQHSYPTFLVNALKRAGLKAGYGMVAANPTNIPDDRWGVTGGWSLDGNIGPAGGTYRSAAGNPNQLYMAPKEDFTSATIYFVRGTGGKADIDSGGVVVGTIDTTVGTPNTYGSATVAISGDATDVFSVKGPTLGPVNILGFSWANSAAPREVEMFNMAQSGVDTGAWVNDSMSLATFDFIDPDLSIIMLGTNDALANVPVNTYVSRLSTIITKAESLGSVIVIGFPECNPTFQAGLGALQDSYEAAVKAHCKAENIPYLDFNGRSGGYSNYVTNDWYRDEVHQSNEANASIAVALADIIL